MAVWSRVRSASSQYGRSWWSGFGPAVVRPLQVELLREQAPGSGRPTMCCIGSVNRGSRPQRLELGAEVGERLDAVEDVGVALPLEHHVVEEVGLERVAARR